MKTIRLEEERVIKLSTNIEYEPLGVSNAYNLVKYKNIVTIITNGKTERKEFYGVAPLSALQTITVDTTSLSDKVEVRDCYKNFAYISKIKKTDLQKVLKGDAHISECIIYGFDDNKIDLEVYEYVLFQPSSYELFDLNGVPIPLAVHLDYMSDLANDYYDLEVCLDKLVKYKDRIIKPTDLKITSIPYYNASDTRNLQLDFWFLPTVEEYKAAKAYNNFTDEMKRYYIHNVFGLKPLED